MSIQNCKIYSRLELLKKVALNVNEKYGYINDWFYGDRKLHSIVFFHDGNKIMSIYLKYDKPMSNGDDYEILDSIYTYTMVKYFVQEMDFGFTYRDYLWNHNTTQLTENIFERGQILVYKF